jgi:uncharacterized protein (TIGR03118 family)
MTARRSFRVAALLAAGSVVLSAASVGSYTQTNLTSDIPGMAANLDPDLVNPWGLTASPTSPFWVSDNGTGLSTLYRGSGSKVPLVVNIPGGGPTGIVFNSGVASGNFAAAPFLFGTESGTIVSWSGGTSGSIAMTGAAGSIYKGLGINDAGTTLYAANFGLGRIDVFDKNFKPTAAPGGFTDPTLPSGYAPFNIQSVGGNLYVTYAKTAGGTDEVDGPGLGFVSQFSADGVFLRRVASQGALNAPWGLALAPKSGFGSFSGDLLVGNFGDGLINAFDPANGMFAGTLDGPNGDPLTNQGLWGLHFGNGAFGQNLDTLYFTAGIPGGGSVEDHGLFGAIDPTAPEPGSIGLLLVGVALGVGTVRRKVGASRHQ